MFAHSVQGYKAKLNVMGRYGTYFVVSIFIYSFSNVSYRLIVRNNNDNNKFFGAIRQN